MQAEMTIGNLIISLSIYAIYNDNEESFRTLLKEFISSRYAKYDEETVDARPIMDKLFDLYSAIEGNTSSFECEARRAYSSLLRFPYVIEASPLNAILFLISEGSRKSDLSLEDVKNLLSLPFFQAMRDASATEGQIVEEVYWSLDAIICEQSAGILTVPNAILEAESILRNASLLIRTGRATR